MKIITLNVGYFLLFLQLKVSSVPTAAQFIDKPYMHHLGPKTSYRFFVNTNTSAKGCSASRIWSMIRHGSRNTGARLTEAKKMRLLEIRNAIAERSKGKCWIENWEYPLEFYGEEMLSNVGIEEMIHMGQRQKIRFEHLLPDRWDWKKFLVTGSYVGKFSEKIDFLKQKEKLIIFGTKIRSTNQRKNIESAKYFSIGLFGGEESERVIIPPPLKRDPILRPYKMCPKWLTQVKGNPDTLAEARKYLKSEFLYSVITNVAKRLNLPPDFFTFSDLRLMYEQCGFETSWYPSKESPWCKIFKDGEFKAVEYYIDMEAYWVDGYGTKLSAEIVCVTFQDLFAHLSDEKTEPFVFYLSHSGVILKLLTHLGLYRDTVPLMGDNFDQQENRMWRTSLIDPFSSNIAFVRYDCNDGEKYVLVLHQEMPVKLPGCPSNSNLCNLKTIERLYKNSLENCDLEKICALEVPATVGESSTKEESINISAS